MVLGDIGDYRDVGLLRIRSTGTGDRQRRNHGADVCTMGMRGRPNAARCTRGVS